jgi:hypothetical protein
MSALERCPNLETNSRKASFEAQSEVPMIRLSGVSKSYRAGAVKNLVLEDINLSVSNGED